ncbi:MAG TPA: F0F1 ATP synthase subunit epsilon [Gemmataceae bacterium]|jgi:F-type H+-transporting ATPase subunit epsilon|nr:F0F1 ATP synthase subunit epsilon [Gemmataceae bacterium]
MASSGKQVQCVVVTPEKAILEETADMVILPMIDGELGVLPGRAALVGRLGKGELRLNKGAEVKKWQLEGGFAQVRGDVVTVLTTRVVG